MSLTPQTNQSPIILDEGFGVPSNYEDDLLVIESFKEEGKYAPSSNDNLEFDMSGKLPISTSSNRGVPVQAR